MTICTIAAGLYMNVEDIRSKDNQQYDHIGHGNDIALLLFVLGKIN